MNLLSNGPNIGSAISTAHMASYLLRPETHQRSGMAAVPVNAEEAVRWENERQKANQRLELDERGKNIIAMAQVIFLERGTAASEAIELAAEFYAESEKFYVNLLGLKSE